MQKQTYMLTTTNYLFNKILYLSYPLKNWEDFCLKSGPLHPQVLLVL